MVEHIANIDLKSFRIREWSLVISGTGAEGIYPGYQNLWLHFTGLWKLLLGFYQATKTFCHKSLNLRVTKTCACDKQNLQNKKQNHRQNQELLQCIFY